MAKGLFRNGMESKFANLAKERNILIYDLEKTEDYRREIIIEFFKGFLAQISKNDITDPSELKNFPEMLDKNINEEYEFMKAGLEKAKESWKIGNLEYFEVYNQRGVPLGFPKEQSHLVLLYEHQIRQARNEEMAKKLMVLIKDGKIPLGAIGARHTVGAGFIHMPKAYSVLRYLEDAGCKVTRLSD